MVRNDQSSVRRDQSVLQALSDIQLQVSSLGHGSQPHAQQTRQKRKEDGISMVTIIGGAKKGLLASLPGYCGS